MAVPLQYRLFNIDSIYHFCLLLCRHIRVIFTSWAYKSWAAFLKAYRRLGAIGVGDPDSNLCIFDCHFTRPDGDGRDQIYSNPPSPGPSYNDNIMRVWPNLHKRTVV
ncbi:MAG: hypothetical protein ACYSYL_06900 [Planctomycetota bacterium]